MSGGEWGEWEHLGSQDSELDQNCIWTLEELQNSYCRRRGQRLLPVHKPWRASVNGDDGLFAGKDQIWKPLSPEWWHHRVICWQLEDEECAQEERRYLQLSLQVRDAFTYEVNNCQLVPRQALVIVIKITASMGEHWAVLNLATLLNFFWGQKWFIFLTLILHSSCSSPRLGRSSRSSALVSRFRSPSSSYQIKTSDTYKKYSESPLDSPSLASSRKTSIVDSYLNREKKEDQTSEDTHNNHGFIDYKELYEKEKREKEVSLCCAYSTYPQIFLGRKRLSGKCWNKRQQFDVFIELQAVRAQSLKWSIEGNIQFRLMLND